MAMLLEARPPRQPGFANLKGVGKRLGLPSFPITISSPSLGLLGPSFALPVKYHIYFGEPLRFEGGADDEDAVIEQRVDEVKSAITALLERGRSERKGIFV
jgi:1-acyl-sn-glycerol-3-phosphate acyltransferase